MPFADDALTYELARMPTDDFSVNVVMPVGLFFNAMFDGELLTTLSIVRRTWLKARGLALGIID